MQEHVSSWIKVFSFKKIKCVKIHYLKFCMSCSARQAGHLASPLLYWRYTSQLALLDNDQLNMTKTIHLRYHKFHSVVIFVVILSDLLYQIPFSSQIYCTNTIFCPYTFVSDLLCQ